MKKDSIFGLILIAILSCTCKPDFIELDLSKDAVNLISPSDYTQTTTLTQTFWWEGVEGASGYEIQIVSPTIANPAILILDSFVVDDQYTITLVPGSYEWAVRAYNGSSSTSFTVYTLTIDSTPDLSSQIIVLTSPVNNMTTNETSITFKWDTLYNADDYRFEVAYPNFNGSLVIGPLTIDGDSSVQSFLTEGTYEWRVRGQNEFSNTAYTTNSFVFDITAPNVPSLVFPPNNGLIPDSSNTLYWDRGTVSGSAIMDSLYIYADTSMTNLVRGIYTGNTSYTDSLGLGDYYWRVISIDAATNKSAYSALRKFTIL